MNVSIFSQMAYEYKHNWTLSENEPKMNVSIFSQMAYEYKHNWTLSENEPKTNPNKPNLPEGEIDAKCVFTKDYEEKCG